MSDPTAEARRLLALHGGGADAAGKALEHVSRHFLVIQSRSQLLLTLATITLTITGFSGPKIAESSVVARVGLAVGLVLVLAAVVALLANLRIRWLTSFLDAGDPEAAIAAAIRYRDAKTRWYGMQIALLALGLSAYVLAVVAYLLAGLR